MPINPLFGTDIPYIDTNVEHVGVSRLRNFNAAKLRTNVKTLVIQENDSPVAVLLAYEKFLCIQRQMESMLNTLELLSSETERAGVLAGIASAKAGKTRSLSDIRKDLFAEE